MARMNPKLAGKYLGVQKDGHLSPCPDDMLNCVCSQHPATPKHYIQGLAFGGTIEGGKAKIQALLSGFKGARVAVEKDNYIRAEFKSRVFGFIDDVEFLIEPSENMIHLRSASRLGYWDLGANRQRVEDIRRRFEASL